MPTISHRHRILAIDLRPQRFGYAVFEGSKRLLDWGAANYRPGGDAGAVKARRSAAKLVSIFNPSVIVVRTARRQSALGIADVKPILGAIQRVALSQGVPVRVLARNDVRKVFRTQHAKTKHDIACRLTIMFPELLWKLPPKREIYESEASAMMIFDAVALGVTYWYMQDSSAFVMEPER